MNSMRLVFVLNVRVKIYESILGWGIGFGNLKDCLYRFCMVVTKCLNISTVEVL